MTDPSSHAPVFTLPSGVVDAWYVALDVPLEERLELTEPLERDELEHWSRMRMDGDRWAVAHGARRQLLAAYLGVSASELRFERGAFGKPKLATHTALRFSASSRGGLALIAISSGIELGADLEREDTASDPERVAREFLSPLEQSALAAVPVERYRHAFALAWARHEAHRKLLGTGLGEPLPAVRGLAPLLVRNITAPEGHAAAIAAQAGDWSVRVREFTREASIR